MAEKGDKAKLKSVARMMFVHESKSRTEIADTLSVSRQTLSTWEKEDTAPDAKISEWEEAKQDRGKMGDRFMALLDRETKFFEGRMPGASDQAQVNVISSLGSLVQRFKAAEHQEVMKSGEYKAAMFLEFLRDLISFFGKQDPSVVQVIEENFDDLIQWGREKYGAA